MTAESAKEGRTAHAPRAGQVSGAWKSQEIGGRRGGRAPSRRSGSEGIFARGAARGGPGQGLAGSPRTAERPRHGPRCRTRGRSRGLRDRSARVCFPVNRRRGDGRRRAGGRREGGAVSWEGGRDGVWGRGGAGDRPRGMGTHALSAARGRG